jgi:hypothetical protein
MQIQRDQAHWEIRCLYLLWDKVLAQDQQIFLNTVDEHVTQPTQQLRSWIQHNKKLILHSMQVATAQLKHNTHCIQTFFPPQHTSWSLLPRQLVSTDQIPLLQWPSCMLQFFPHARISWSHQRPCLPPIPTNISTYFGIVSISQSVLPQIVENQELVTNTIQQQQLQQQALNIPELSPDHPG